LVSVVIVFRNLRLGYEIFRVIKRIIRRII